MAGFTFQINDEQLFLGLKSKISISQESILLTEKTIAGAISFPFNIPNTPNNRKLLNISNTLMSFNENQNIKCKLFLAGNFWKTGFILINNQDQKNINISYTEFNSEEDFEQKTLQDLPFKKLNTSGVFYENKNGAKSVFHNDLVLRAFGVFPEKDFVCASIFNIKTLDVTKNLAYQNFFADGRYFPDYYEALNDNCISPFLYISHINDLLFQNLNLNIKSNKLKEKDLKYLILYTNKVNIVHTQYRQTPATEFFAEFAENEMDLSKYVPNVSLSNYLTSIKSTFNLFYLIDFTENTVEILNKTDTLKSAKTIDISSISEPFTALVYNKDFKKITSVVYAKSEDAIITDDTSRFTLKNFQYKGSVDSVFSIPNIIHQPNDYYIVKLSQNTYGDSHYFIFYDTNGTWNISLFLKIMENRPYDVYFLNKQKNENIYNLNIDTTILRKNEAFYTTPHADGSVTVEPFNKYKFYCPTVDIGIASNKNWSFYTNEIDKQTDIDVTKTIRLLFYRGMRQEMKTGNSFPFANRNEFNFTTTPSPTNDELTFTDTFDHSLEIDGPKGLWEKFHREWQEFLQNLSRLVTYNIRFSPAQIISGNLFLNFMQIDSKKFIISKLTITGDANSIDKCKTEMYQIEPK